MNLELVCSHPKENDFCRCVEWALRYKELGYQYIGARSAYSSNLAMVNNALQDEPILMINGHAVMSALAIIDCIEEFYPSPTLVGRDPYQRAFSRRLCLYLSQYLSGSLTSLLRDEKELGLVRALLHLEPLVCQQSVFAMGTAFSMVDIFVIVAYQRLLRLEGAPIAFYHDYLHILRKVRRVCLTEPFLKLHDH